MKQFTSQSCERFHGNMLGARNFIWGGGSIPGRQTRGPRPRAGFF